jgi:hypothetical protein
MTCADCRETFSAYADEALAAEGRAAVEQHMAGCAECRREWQRFLATVDLLRAVPRERAPAGFVDRVLAATRPLPWYRRLARALLVPWTVKLPLEAAAIVMVAGLAVLVLQRLPEPAYFSAVREAPPAPPPADTKARFMEQQELLAPASRPAESSAQAFGDTRVVPGAKPDTGRAETAPPSIAQPPSQEPLVARRQQLPEQVAAPPPPLKSVPAAPNVAATGESVDEARAKRQDKLAKESERDAMRGLSSSGLGAGSGSRERKVEESPEVQRLIARSVAPNVELRLATADREASAREIAAIVERLGGALITRAPDTLEIMVPNRAFAALTGDLSRLGTLRIVQQPAELPDSIRITLRLTD